MSEISTQIIGIGDLNRTIAQLLEDQVGVVWVRGEISNFKAYDSGHWYFSLKDSEGQIKAVMFRGRNSQLGFVPKEGDLIEVSAQLSMYVPRGDVQLNVQLMRKAGQGGLYEAFLRLKEKLSKEGLFDESKKRPLPPFPQAIGVITSPQAAALKDVLSTLERRAPHIPVTIFPSLVQGSDAPASLINALQNAYQQVHESGIEVLMMVRGGGSIEDLWAFNDEALARVISQSPVPLVSGVGHETDFTIADFVADLRAPTPTAAAELVAPNRDVLLKQLDELAHYLALKVNQLVERESQRIDQLSLRLQHALPQPQQMRDRAIQLQARLNQSWTTRWQSYQHEQERIQAHLNLLHPQRTLDRGYAIVLNDKGHVLVDPEQLSTNASYQVMLAQGQAHIELAAVKEISKLKSSK